MDKRLKYFVIINMAVVIVGLSIAFYSYWSAGRYFARDVLYIAPFLNETGLHFHPEDVDILSRVFPGYTFSPQKRGNIRIATSFQEASSVIFYVNTSYFQMNNMNFIEGSVWRSNSAENVMVINEALAWRLFGTVRDITGMTAWVGDTPHTIGGVVRQPHNTNNLYTVWMSYTQSSPQMLVTTLFVRPASPDPLAIVSIREMVLTYLNQNPDYYSIVDINRFIESIGVRFRILLYLFWCIILVMVMKTVRKILLAGACAFLLILWGVNDILTWLPNFMEPEISLFRSISMIGAMPPEGYLLGGLRRIAGFSRNTNYAFIAVLVGYVNLMFGLGGVAPISTLRSTTKQKHTFFNA